jgi:hypothetical protein
MVLLILQQQVLQEADGGFIGVNIWHIVAAGKICTFMFVGVHGTLGSHWLPTDKKVLQYSLSHIVAAGSGGKQACGGWVLVRVVRLGPSEGLVTH